MSDNVPPAKQRTCLGVDCEDDKYIVDVYSLVQPGQHGHNELRKQLFLYVTKDQGNSRKEFLQVSVKKDICDLYTTND